MTAQKHLKALVRARMSRTGESYATARSHLVERASTPSLTPAAEFRAHDRHCMTVVFTPDDGRLVSGGFGGQARIWTLEGEPDGELVGHESSVNVVRVSADGALAVTAASDRTVRLWDLPARRERALLGTHRKQVLALDLDDARGHVWSGGHDGRLLRWDLESGEPADPIDLGGNVTSVAVRRSDGLVAASTVGAGVRVIGADGTDVARLADGEEVATSVAWAHDGSFVIASVAGRALVWESDGWDVVRELPSGGGGVLPVALAPDGSRIALGWDHHVALWGPDADEPAVTLDGLPKGVYGLAFSHDGRHLAMAAADGRVRTWRIG